MALSTMQRFVISTPQEERDRIFGRMSDSELVAIMEDWHVWARPEQLEPEGDHVHWLYLAGRGAGKTRTGAEWVHERVHRGLCKIGALIAPTAGSARDVMIEGPSGLLPTQKSLIPGMKCRYQPSKRKITYENGAELHVYSADQPERLRGPQHDTAWCDELGSWRYPEAWDMLMFGLRLGNPKSFISTTPKPIKLIRELVKDPYCVVTKGSTYDNLMNLAAAFRRAIVDKYEGTTLGQQELHAVILDELPGALWSRPLIQKTRVRWGDVPELARIVVGVDPAVASPADRDEDEVAEAGIVVAGLGVNGHAYILADLSLAADPHRWGMRAVNGYIDWSADRVLGEVNNGGDLVEFLIRACAMEVGAEVSYKAVRASHNKVTRAEPIAAYFEQGRAHIVGAMEHLEDQLVQMMPAMLDSPDRADAMVWALAELMNKGDLGAMNKHLGGLDPQSMQKPSDWLGDPSLGGVNPEWGSM